MYGICETARLVKTHLRKSAFRPRTGNSELACNAREYIKVIFNMMHVTINVNNNMLRNGWHFGEKKMQ